jgi:gamma-glutamyltranspeptidase/glutathione hydrolase
MSEIKMSGWEIRRAEVVAANGVVTAKRPSVAQIGVEVLQSGGNAVDAAVAMCFAIDVAEPPMTGLGGGGFMTVSLANGESYVVDFFPRAPGGATPDMYELTPDFKPDKLGFTGIKDNANVIRHKAVGIPGAVAGPLVALEKWGTKKREEVLAPAIKLAREGFELTWYETLATANALNAILTNPETTRLYLKDGKPLLAGMEQPNYLRLPELADTLEKISKEGADAFYKGEIGEKIVAELQKGGCPTSIEDFAGYEALVKEPLKLNYRDCELVLIPGASGGPTIAEIVNLLEGFDLAAYGHNSGEYLHLLIEACKLSLADRLAYLAEQEPGGAYIAWRELASKEYAEVRRKAIGNRAGAPYQAGKLPTIASSAYAGNNESCTTFLSAWDKDGNAVAVTQTLNGYYGSAVAVPGTGVVLNNAMVLFDPRPGQLNSVQGGKRPLSSMAHFVARKNGQNYCLAGAPGGRKIVDTVAQMLLNMLDFDLTAQEACGSPFIDPAGEITLVDRLVGEAALNRLTALGHKIAGQQATVWPRLSANPGAIKRKGGLLYGGTDLFTAGVAAGY